MLGFDTLGGWMSLEFERFVYTSFGGGLDWLGFLEIGPG